MTETLRHFSPFKMKTSITQEQQQVLISLADTKLRLRAAENYFEQVSDPDLIEACIYELNSLETQYRYFLRQARLIQAEQDHFLKGRIPIAIANGSGT